MPLDRAELQSRISGCKPNDMLRGSVFRAIVGEAELRLAHNDPRLARVHARYNKGALSDLFNFPVTDWLSLLWDACDAVEQFYGAPDPALRAMGRAVADSFLNSVVGKVALSIGANKKPIEMLFHAPAVYAAGASYGTRTPKRIDERHGKLEIRGDYAPAQYHVGLLQQGLQVNGHKVQVVPKVHGPFEYDLEITWVD